MGFFGSNTKALIARFRKTSEVFSDDLSKEIDEQLDDLQNDYRETESVVPEFQAFIEQIKGKLENKDAHKLDEFARRLTKLSHSARKGVMAMWELSYSQRKIKAETLAEFDELEYK